MSDDHTITFFVNPLFLFNASNFPTNEKKELTSLDVLEYLASDNKLMSVAEMKNNYQLLDEKISSFFGVPSEAQILNKMIFPLKRAVGYFVIGNYRESIAVAAFVAEMATIFKFQIYNISLLERPIVTELDESKNLGEIELLPQGKRIKKLLDEEVINHDLACKFDFVRLKRNKYLHSITKEDNGIQDIAKAVIENTIDIMKAVTGLRIGNGKVLLDPRVIEYLRKKGFLGNTL